MKKNIHDVERFSRVLGGTFLSSLAFWGPKKAWYLLFLIPVAEGLAGIISTRKDDRDMDNEYMPVQSDSEKAAGHPIVGVA